MTTQTLAESGLLETFIYMDRRRLERFSCGRTQAKSSRMYFMRSVGTFMVLLMFLTQVTLNANGKLVQLLQSGWMILALIFTTVVLIFTTVRDCLQTKDHIFCKMGLCVFYLCALWYLREFRFSTDSPLVFNANQWAIIVVCLTLEIVLLLGYLGVFVLYTNVGKVLSRHVMADRLWYRFRREKETKFSYSPYGIFGRRHTFEYEGSLNESSQPHGLGIWRDTSFHGEIFRGQFVNGLPQGFFQSREKSSEALFACHPILIATSRQEALNESQWYPSRDPQGLRYAIADVECSYGSTYYRNLPAVRKYQQSRKLSDVLEVYETHCGNCERTETDINVERVADLRELSSSSNHQKFEGVIIGNTVFVNRDDFKVPTVEKEALVFFHGFNCSIEFAACKLAQLLALGKFPKNVVPFVFSQSAGKALSYFPALRELPAFAKDAANFFNELRSQGFTKFHLLGHSMGCDLLLQTFYNLVQDQVLAEAKRLTPHSHRKASALSLDVCEQARPLMEIKNIMLLNADVDVDTFAQSHLENLRQFTQLTTILVDRSDRALWFAELGQNKKKIGNMKSTQWIAMAGFDIIDTTDMQHNIHSMRHSYFNLNMQIVADLDEILSSGKPATERRSLVCRGDGVFAFLCPPAFITADRARA